MSDIIPTEPAVYTSRPTRINAMKYVAPNQPFHGGNIPDIQAWGAIVSPSVEWGEDGIYNILLYVKKGDAEVKISDGDWIIQESDGDGFYPCVNAEFVKKYALDVS